MYCSNICRQAALRSWPLAVLSLAVIAGHCAEAARTLDHVSAPAAAAASVEPVLPNVTHAGFLPVDAAKGSRMFYTYHEAQQGAGAHVPIILWLEVRSLLQAPDILSSTACSSCRL